MQSAIITQQRLKNQELGEDKEEEEAGGGGPAGGGGQYQVQGSWESQVPSEPSLG